jgi:hypothetical protein
MLNAQSFLQEDDSEFHTIWMGYFFDEEEKEKREICEKRIFTIPKQNIVIRFDNKFGRFVIVKVVPESSTEEFWLVISIRTRRGFLIPLHAFIPNTQMEDDEIVFT